MRKTVFSFFLVISVILISCDNSKSTAVINSEPIRNPYNWVKSVHTSLGVPFDNDSSDDYIIVRPQYVLSYNKNDNIPNWVAWELNSNWFGDVSRFDGNFIADTSLPEGYYQVKHSDYTNSGYDRGHMVMSEERTKTVEDNMSTFILTNIIPQKPDLNRGVWLKFESFCNDLCLKNNKELFIFAGPISHNKKSLKDENKVIIPDSCYKIVVVLEQNQTLNDINANTEVYSVIMPNDSGIRNDDWVKYKTTIRKIEYSTGYNFLNNISVNIQNIIETKN